MPKRQQTIPYQSSKLATDYSLKNKQPDKLDIKWRARFIIVCIESNRHYLYIENQATGKTRPCNVNDVIHKLPAKLWNADTMFGRAGKSINYLANVPTIPLNTT